MQDYVKFVYKDGFVKHCSRKEAEVLQQLGRGKIEGEKKVEAPKPVEVPKPVEAPKPVEPEIVAPTEPVKRRGRPAKV